MGKEDIGLLINTISVYRTIDLNYFSTGQNGNVLESLLALEE
jgi:hypothetical protein